MAWRARKEAELAAARPMQSSSEEGRQRAEAEATAERRPEEPRGGRGLARQSSASRRMAWRARKEAELAAARAAAPSSAAAAPVPEALREAAEEERR